MDNLQPRLLRCFSLVFPNLSDKDLENASMETVEEWDSVVNITLVNVVEEEFAVQIALEEIEEMLSFRRFLDYLKTKKVAVT